MIGQIIVTGPALADAAATVVEPPAGRSAAPPKDSVPADHGAH
jgi:hypothetical protein